MNWLDWLIVSILVISALQGLRYGLFVSVAKLLGVLAGLAVAHSYYRPLAGYLSAQWHLDDKLLPMITPFFKFWLPVKNAVYQAIPSENLMFVWNGPAAAQNLPGALGPLSPIGNSFANVFAFGILEAIAFLSLLLVTVWLVSIVGLIFTKIIDLSLLGPLNHLGGLLFGLTKGLLVVLIILTLISPFQRQDLISGGKSGETGAAGPQGRAFQNSMLLPYFAPAFGIIEHLFQMGSLNSNEIPVLEKSIY
ncbi:MAG: Colicin V production protein [Pelotomaculum sp. PtaU1.Bin035]|nr:MAG: Colicin V production protein [Pelotomaculum sp. PtaU1.Bin035]